MASFIGDDDIETTYAAVGRALSCWEGVEVSLATLYAFLKTGSLSIYKVRDYGTKNRIFVDRLRAIENCAHRHFVNNPSQELESSFNHLATRAKSLSKRRNLLAHGVVMAIEYFADPDDVTTEYYYGRTFYSLHSPWYAVDRANSINNHGMDSKLIALEIEPFERLARDIDAYILRLRALPQGRKPLRNRSS